LAAPYGASVDALHVIEPEIEDFVIGAASRGGDVASLSGDADRVFHAAWLLESAAGWVEGLLDEVGAQVNRTRALIGFGDPGSEIIGHARKSAADLVVVGRGGDAARACARTGVVPLGSTARLVTWAAPCPVLVVPVHRSLGAGPPPSERERDRHTRPDVIPLRSIMGGDSSQVPPAARRGRAGDDECAA
jgi:nucleotide-binding universal stress UspA family protein